MLCSVLAATVVISITCVAFEQSALITDRLEGRSMASEMLAAGGTLQGSDSLGELVGQQQAKRQGRGGSGRRRRLAVKAWLAAEQPAPPWWVLPSVPSPPFDLRAGAAARSLERCRREQKELRSSRSRTSNSTFLPSSTPHLDWTRPTDCLLSSFRISLSRRLFHRPPAFRSSGTLCSAALTSPVVSLPGPALPACRARKPLSIAHLGHSLTTSFFFRLLLFDLLPL